MRQHYSAGMAIVLASAMALGCGRGASGNVVIGAAGAWNQGYTQTTQQGLALAVEEINARRLVPGRTVRLLLRDDGAGGAAAAQVAQQFVADPLVVGVVGHLNSGAMAVAARVYDGRLAAVSPSASSPDLSGISPWAFRVMMSDSATGAALGRFAAGLGRRAAVLYENDSYGRGLADAFRRHFDGDVVSVDPISPTAGDVEPFVTYYARVARPDVVFVAGMDGTGRALLREARRQRLPARFLGGDGWAGVAVDTAAAEGAYVALPFHAGESRPATRAFVAAFRRRYRRDPDGYAALAYDAAMVFAHAVAAVGADREQVRDYLATLRARGGHAGVSGAISFTESGDPETRAVRMAEVRRGALAVLGGD